jgi:hypothetical protein
MCGGVADASDPESDDPRVTFTDVRHPKTKKVVDNKR